MAIYERTWWWVKEKKQMALVFIIVTMMLQFHMKGCVGCVETERIGLLELKSYLSSSFPPGKESILQSWSDDDRSSDCCNWERVKCSDDTIGGHIVDLSLSQIMDSQILDNDPSWPLNLSLLHSFPRLQSLNVSGNNFNNLFDPIHGYKSFQRLKKLRTLDLTGNDLNNSVFTFLSEARSLRTLYLGGNSLEGVFPPNELANLTKLREFNLQGNAFRSFSVQGLINFRELEMLDLSVNKISDFESGDDHMRFRGMEKLRTLDLSFNGLNISVLPVLSALRSLKTLNLRFNKLEGVFPPEELANMTELTVLNLEGNEFTFFSVKGLINFRELEVLDLSCNSIHDLEANNELRTTNLNTLDLSGNEFSDTAQLKGLEHLVELKVLRLADNKFYHTGSIQVFKDMPKLQELDLSDNNFTDIDLVFPSSLQVLNLRENQLSLSPEGYSEICRLRDLRELGLRNNSLTSMPNCLGNLSRLRTLDLSHNQLKGDLSFFVSSLPSALEYLSLLDNSFKGSFLFSSLVNQSRLTVFKLSSKEGMIQAQAESSWVPLFQLKILKLQNLNLGSTIPGFLIHQHDLCVIDLSHNNLTGAFPTWLIQNNTRLEKLLLNINSLAELQLPRLVHGLRVLDISSNIINDLIQEDIGTVFPNLTYMNFASNRFQGTIPSSMGEMESLQFLDMSSNGLSGQLPETVLSGCYSLRILKLSNNQFHGEVFPEHANLTGLAWLALDGNNFNGSLGKGLLNSKHLHILDISNNSISGTLPLWIEKMSSLRYLYMRGNQLKGPFPSQLQKLQLILVDIAHNSFSGSIPRNLDFSTLKLLKLQSNEFMGSIPDTLLHAEELEVLDLRNNNFSGKISITIGRRTNLRVLLLRNNSLHSHIPEKVCLLSKVGLLDLSYNRFKGVIPSCLGNMSFGAAKYNRFKLIYVTPFSSTTIFKHWSYTSALHLDDDLESGDQWTPTTVVDFLTKSRYEAYQGDIVGDLYGLDLSSNQLSGEIPVEIGALQNIISLNFSSNQLKGSIPDSISKLKDLESLDLSNNKLDGSIPPQLADLSSLGYFNISFNNLSGEIPTNGHLLTFGETSYIGNDHLCGGPTNKTCNPATNASNQDNEKEEEGDDLIDMAWFYWTCGAVYISTFLALFAFLCIDSSWSREWFYRVDLLIYHLHLFKGRFVFK